MTENSPNSRISQLAEAFVQRYRRGEQPTIDEYVEQHPDLADEIRKLFPSLVPMEQAKNSARDSSTNASDVKLAGKETTPQKLGDFRILREIGRGGMGIVYEAEQESLGRHVALKVLPSHAVLDATHLQRFQREARAVARLHHTNIVPVYGVGQNDGVHYFVMQYIQGQGLDVVIRELQRLKQQQDLGRTDTTKTDPAAIDKDPATQMAWSMLTECYVADQSDASDSPSSASTGGSAPAPSDPNAEGGGGETLGHGLQTRSLRRDALPDSLAPLSDGNGNGPLALSTRHYWKSVARIGQQVASALDYAHAQGTVHRDIKPGNLLLDVHGMVWVTDFGLAKGGDQDNLTQTGDVLGTLRYMAPESLQGDSAAYSDIYALGLTLYELASLQPARSAGHRNELLRQVTQGDVPRLRKVSPEVPRDLETIIHKAIDPDPKGRYATAGQMATDLERFINDEPIQARQIHLGERLWRWTKRNPVVAGLTGTLAVVLLAAAVGSAIAALRFQRLADKESEARAEAEQAAQESEAVVDYLIKDMIQSVQPTRALGKEITVREVLDEAADRVGSAFADQPNSQAAVRHAMGQAYLALGRYDEAHHQLTAALKLRRELLGAEHPTTLITMRDLSGCLTDQGKYAEAQQLLVNCLESQRRVLGPEHLDTLTTVGNLGVLLGHQHKFEEAQQILQQNLQIMQRVHGSEHPDTLNAMHRVAWVLEQQEALPEAAKRYQQVFEARRRVLGPDHPDTVYTMNNLAVTLDRQGKYADAQQLYEQVLEIQHRVLGPKHPGTAMTMGSLGASLHSQGKYVEAQKLVEQVLEIQMSVMGQEHPKTLTTMYNLAVMLDQQGKYDAAQKLYEQTLDAGRRVFGPEHPATLNTMNNLAYVLFRQRKYQEAQQRYEDILEVERRLLGLEHPNALRAMLNVASCLVGQEDYSEAQKIYRQTLDISRQVLGPDDQHTLNATSGLATCLSSQGNYEEAQPLYEQVVQINRRLHGPDHRDTLSAIQSLAALLQDQGKHQQAEPLVRQLLQKSRQAPAEDEPNLASVLAMAGWALSETGQAEEAEPLLRESVKIRREKLETGNWLIANTESLLGHCLAELKRYDQAEPLLLDSYQALKAAANVPADRIRQALERIITLYEVWDKPDEAAKWRAMRNRGDDSGKAPGTGACKGLLLSTSPTVQVAASSTETTDESMHPSCSLKVDCNLALGHTRSLGRFSR